ncbi:MAG TPA: hypothetical protein PK079_07325 [Leptospiraceae bacterium]|nr:hypothetical protein [Leptospiraceae bacterium]HMW05776.1 hypothetical protein [Leptospiraceae bacterium]HMX32635.1 hypothetical protein [Leptospiraceae bacterium]HMY33349.1 hypothetical protein [Leptospiraceae bacterium]HMZ65422.1 hypothetical protein [Leptospiraceae bacterium]
MNEVKEVIWSERNLLHLKDIILNHKNLDLIPNGFNPDIYKKLKLETREFLSRKFNIDFTVKPIIANGHQPELQHPGILFKDLLVHRIAAVTDSLPLHIVVDTDQFEMTYTYPEKVGDGYAHLKTLHLKDAANRIYLHRPLTQAEKEELVSILNSQKQEAKSFVAKEQFESLEKILDRKIELLKTNDFLHEINEIIRSEFYTSRNIQIHTINVSELVNLNSFKALVNTIRENLDAFMQVYNNSLAEYRKEHKIKNHAQPIPNLISGEMPFWILDPNTNKRNVMKLDDSLDHGVILPKAVTLTMFMRLFIADFFIHGKGGGRYEEVSEHIIKDFFKIEAAPYEVASATMNLNHTNQFKIPTIEEKDLDAKLRDIVYSPDKFLEPSHPLVLQKKELQSKFKNPDSDKKELHKSISSINEELSKLILPEKEKLEQLKQDFPLLQHTNQVFQSRTMPFYYYYIDELIKYVQNYT